MISASDTPVFTFDAKKTRELRDQLDAAVLARKREFTWHNITWQIDEAKRLLSYLERRHREAEREQIA